MRQHGRQERSLPWRRTCLVLVCSILALCTQQTQAQCRQKKGAALKFCGLPYELSNFQGYHKCSASVVVGRPKNVQELSALVQAYSHVKANGVGHSWWGQQFCAGSDANAINIVTTEMDSTLATLNGTFGGAISVDEDAGTVTVAAGVSQRVLLDYLDKFRTKKAKDGYTLAAFSWFIDQTIGGAVSTGTHGSSLKHGSLSSQLVKLHMVLADGTALELTPSDGHLWHAARISVGRLGIITSLTLKIVQNEKVQRTRRFFSWASFGKQLQDLQKRYVAAKATGSGEEVWKVLQPWDEVQVFWFPASKDIWKLTYTRKKDAKVTLPTPNVFAAGARRRQLSLPQGAYTQVPNSQGRVATGRTSWGANFWNTIAKVALRANTFNANLPARASYLSLSEFENQQYNGWNSYDQYEVAVPLHKVGDCMKAIGDEMYSKAALWKGFRSPPLIRFVAGESAYLSPTHGEPRMYINIEDHVGPHNGTYNAEFQRVMTLLRSPLCSGRMHWGKAGWPQHAKCFDGAQELGSAWCHFGCAVQQLDPAGKFASTSDVWRWQATAGGVAGGQPVEFGGCCTPQGFDTSRCTCAPRTNCA